MTVFRPHGHVDVLEDLENRIDGILTSKIAQSQEKIDVHVGRNLNKEFVFQKITKKRRLYDLNHHPSARIRAATSGPGS